MDKVTLGDIAQIAISNVDKKTKANEKIVRLCNFTDVYKNWSITCDEAEDFMVASASERQISQFTIKTGQVAITKDSETRDDIGIATYIAAAPNDTVLGYHCALITPNEEKIIGRYLNALLQSNYARKVFEFNASGSGQRYTLTTEALEGLQLEIPDIKTQEVIGDFLENIERKIKCNKKLIKELEETARLIYDYWFTQFDFPDEDGKPYRSSGGKMVWNDKLKREIPEGWEAGKTGDMIEGVRTGLNPRQNFKLTDHGWAYLTVKNLTVNGEIDFTNCDFIDDDARAIAHKRSDISRGDILFASIAPLGRCHLIQADPEDWEINESVFSIRPNTKRTSSEYLYLFLTSKWFIKAAESSSAGSVFKGIRNEELRKLSTFIPHYSVIQSFTLIVRNLFSKMEKLSNENRKLNELREWLLPLLMNGQATIGE